MALADLARAALARLAHALALAGLREPGAAPPPPPGTATPVATPWPEPPPPRRERKGPILDGSAARDRARREAMLLPALALLIGLALSEAASQADGSRLLPGDLRGHPAQVAGLAPRRTGSPRFEPGPPPRPARRRPKASGRPASGPGHPLLRWLAGRMAALARGIGRASLRRRRRTCHDVRLARAGLSLARRLNRWSLALAARGTPQADGKGVFHGG